MNKEFLVALLKEYDDNKGTYRRIFGDTSDIKGLRRYVNTTLAAFNNNDEIRGPALQNLYQMLCERKKALSAKDAYFNNANLGNHIFHKIIFALATDHFNARKRIQRRLALNNQPNTYLAFAKRSIVTWMMSTIPDDYFLGRKGYLYSFLSYLDGDFLSLFYSPTILIETPIDPDEFSNVIVNFSYEAVLGQRNTDHLAMDALEDLDPATLALTSSGELIFADDVVTLYKQTGTFRNPQSKEDNSRELSSETLNRIIVTKPVFRQALTDAVNERIGSEWNNREHVTAATVHFITQTGLRMSSDHSKDYTASYKAIADLRSYLDLLPERSRRFILNFKANEKLTVNELLNSHDICRHIVGNILTNVGSALSVYIADDNGTSIYDALNAATVENMDNLHLINGLRI